MVTKISILEFLALALSMEFLLVPTLPTQAQSPLKTGSATLPERIVFQENFNPPGSGKPQDTSGAGSRSRELRCSQAEKPIRPLMPERNYGLTLKERPPIFVDLPQTSAKQVVLMFQDETGEYYERAFLDITGRGGIVSFNLPDEKPPLAVGKNYQWSLVIVCGKTVQPDDPVFRGWVQRTARTSLVESELGEKTAIEQAAWYGAKGYWYDMLAAMAQVRRSHPGNTKITALWRDLLETVGLGAIASEPLK